MARFKNQEIDILIGKNLTALRLVRGLSQQAVSAEFGLTTQQLSKYEKGINRTPAALLYSIAKFFDVSIEHFFALGSVTDKTAISHCRVSKMLGAFARLDAQLQDAVCKFVLTLTKEGINSHE